MKISMKILKTLLNKLKVEGLFLIFHVEEAIGVEVVRKDQGRKGRWIVFFTSSAEAVVQNRSGKMTQTTISDAYKKETRERACSLISR